jgi:cytochrome c-type biogenesis protein CcmE
MAKLYFASNNGRIIQNENIINKNDETYVNDAVTKEKKMEKKSKIQPSL